jgi:hypothetical protein
MRWLLSLILVLAGCTEPSRAPLYSPLSARAYFGYTEQPVNPNTVRVTYLTPPVRVNASSEIGAVRSERMNLAYDIAVWRAAELALAAGYPAFSITDLQSDGNVNNYNYQDSGIGFGVGAGRFSGGTGFGTGLSFGLPDRWIDVSARTSFIARFEPENRPGNYNAQFAVDQARAKYGNVLVAGY